VPAAGRYGQSLHEADLLEALHFQKYAEGDLKQTQQHLVLFRGVSQIQIHVRSRQPGRSPLESQANTEVQ